MAEAKATVGAPEIKSASPFKSTFPYIAIAICAVVAYLVFYNVLGDPSNFEGGDPAKGHPNNTFGLIFKGGFIVPIVITLLLILFTFVVERLFTILRASGKGNKDVFVKKIQRLLAVGDISGAIAECDRQSGSIGSVAKAGLVKYQEMAANKEADKETKKHAIEAELEKATMLELPAIERNLPILATVASLGTLVGLIGTVFGMIRSFSALGAGGAPNAAELSVGISEALINTALGITTSALSILFYNFFTTRIDGMVYTMDEVGYSIVQTFDQREH